MGVRSTCFVCLELSMLSFLLMTCRERLNESLPKDGEMLQPDEWYPTTAKYFGFVEVPGQDVFLSVPNQSEAPPYLSEPLLHQQPSTIYPSAETSLYSNIVSDFLPPSPHVPPKKPSQGTFNPELSMRSTDQTFAGALPPDLYANHAGSYYMPEDPQIQRQVGGSEIDQAAVGNWVSYQTPDFIYALQQYFSTI